MHAHTHAHMQHKTHSHALAHTQIIIGDTLTALGEQIIGPDLWYLDRRVLISAVGLGVLFPLCCLKCVKFDVCVLQ